MTQIIRSLLVAGVVCAGVTALSNSVAAQGFYLDADAGVALAEDVKLKTFLVPTPGAKLKLDPGSRVSVSGGYNFNEYIGAGLETGFISNLGKDDDDISLSHVPIMANVVLRYDKPDSKWVPFGGAGAGGDVSIIALDDVRAPNGAIVDGSAGSLEFGFQAFAGLRYRFKDNMSLGAVYKFYFSEGAEWDVRRSAGDIETGSAQVHSIGVEFNMTF
jgi:opacity protein-like surface antigen